MLVHVFMSVQKQQGADFVRYMIQPMSAVWCSFSRPKRILGLCYVVVKVSILMNFDIL